MKSIKTYLTFSFLLIFASSKCIAYQNTKPPELYQHKGQIKQNKLPKAQPYMCFCIPSDDAFFKKLLDLIGSIHHTNFDKLKEIAVFDLGLTKDQLNFLKSIEKVSVHSVELRHPDILKPFKARPYPSKKIARGWYAWKPIIIKQAASLFDYFLYLDAGCTVLKPLDDIFTYIQDRGYLLMQTGVKYTIGDQCTKYVISKFSLSSPENSWILNKRSIASGIQGISNRIYDSYVKPIYELTTDLRFFEDDGSSRLGFGSARHDQILFGIQAILLNLESIPVNKNYQAFVQGKKINICFGSNVNSKDIQILYQHSSGKFIQFIKFKK